MEEKYHKMFVMPDVAFEIPKHSIKYITSDGKSFTDKLEAEIHDDVVSRQMYFEHLMKKRNWFQRLFNIEPDMSFYDSIALKAKLNRK